MDKHPRQHPIALGQVFFTRTVVVSMPNHKTTTDGLIVLPPENTLDVAPMPEMPGEYIATMRTRLNPENDPSAPYHIDMECVAFFKADDSLSEDEAMRGVTITAHSVLYGAIRESISWITGRHPHGALGIGLSVLQNKQKTETKE